MQKVNVSWVGRAGLIEAITMSKAEYKKNRKALKKWGCFENNVTGEVVAIPPMGEDTDAFLAAHQRH